MLSSSRDNRLSSTWRCPHLPARSARCDTAPLPQPHLREELRLEAAEQGQALARAAGYKVLR